MAFTQTDLTKLETAIASGVLTVKFRDRLKTFQSTSDMIRVRNQIRAELGISTPDGCKPRIINIQTGKGL